MKTINSKSMTSKKAQRSSLILRSSICRFFFLFSIAFMCGIVANASLADEQHASAVYDQFRKAVPGHFQDWIVEGNGPRFTLLYTEPPPAHKLSAYGDVLKAVLRGYQSHTIKSRKLGYNGRVSDLVIHLDYSGVPGDPKNALDADIRALSAVIYDTSHGARALPLHQVLDGGGPSIAPEPISITAVQLEEWLFEKHPLHFSSPEQGLSGTLKILNEQGATGRFLASDNSLVLLLINHHKGVDATLIPDIRRFAVDSDFILGGVDATKHGGNYIALIGRARQVPLAQFPALRVEDLVTAMTAEDQNWAQSYDRNTPGAGKAEIHDGKVEDWAPSYLSPDLIDTEFGSLLNWADAILKSQSLSGTIEYRGFDISAFSNPPYEKGVFDHLHKKVGQTALVFNFNTVGVGHWLERQDRPSIYALNSTGSFSVTYSPEITGQDSILDHAQVIEETETAYTDWFRKQRSPELVRTVQYMAVYQVFSQASLKGDRLYADSQAKFKVIGQKLKASVQAGATESLNAIKGTEEEKLGALEAARVILQFTKGFDGIKIPPIPGTMDQLGKALAEAATSVRYDGNLYGERLNLLMNRYRVARNQDIGFRMKNREQINRLFELNEHFRKKYKPYETGETQKLVDGEWATFIEYEVPQHPQLSFNKDKAELKAMESKIKPVLNYLSQLIEKHQALEAEINEAQASYVNTLLLIDAAALIIEADNPKAFATQVLKAFESRTAASKFDASVYAIATPTIVVSVDSKDSRMTGGHNVEARKFIVALDDTVAKGGFRLGADKLSINPTDALHMDVLSARMARMADADPATQKRLFDETIRKAGNKAQPRRVALGIKDAVYEPIYKPSPDVSLASKALPDNALLLGRDTSSKRLYIEQVGPDGQPQRTLVIGATKVPEIVAKRSNQKYLEVLLDPSLSPGDIDAIISNFKHSRGLKASVGSTSTTSPRRGWWKAGHADEPVGPRLVIFKDPNNGRRRIIADTPRGRVELIARQGIEADRLVELLRTKIDEGAELAFGAAKSGKSGDRREFLLIDTEIKQATTVQVRTTANALPGHDLLVRGRTWFQKVMRRAFGEVKGKETVTDYIIEVNRRTDFEKPGWDVHWMIEVGPTGLRFVANPIWDKSMIEPVQGEALALKDRK